MPAYPRCRFGRSSRKPARAQCDAAALEAALNVQAEIQARLAEAARLRRQLVQRAEYEANQSQIRYMRVDPNNRLVADTLEARWNEKLRMLAEAGEECEKQERLDAAELTAEQKERILALSAEFPKLWADAKTLDRDHKRMARLLLEDVTLRRDDELIVQIRFKGRATQSLRLPLPQRSWERWTTKPEIIHEIDRLLDQYTDSEIARIFNERGVRTDCAGPFNTRKVCCIRWYYHLKSRRQRLQDSGWITRREMAKLLDCPCTAVNHWRAVGLLTGTPFDDRNDYLYKRPTDEVVAQIRARQQRRRWKSSNPSPYILGAV